MSQNNIIGHIYPVIHSLIPRILDQNKMFLKISRGKKKLNQGDKLLFYASREIKKVVGEAEIKNIEYLSKDEALNKYGSNLFLTKDEINQYIRNPLVRDKSSTIKMAVFNLKNQKRYSNPFKPYGLNKNRGFVAVSGQYITDSWYEKYARENI